MVRFQGGGMKVVYNEGLLWKALLLIWGEMLNEGFDERL
jgi:hypothetical protein